MKKLLPFITLILVFGVSAQKTDIQAEGEAEARKEGYSLLPFDSTVTKLPKNFIGNPIEYLTNRFHTLFQGSKGEFETTQEYAARMERQKTEPITKDGKLLNSSQVAFSLKVEPKYNADTSQFTVEIYFPSSFNSNEIEKPFLTKTTNTGTYEGQNGFGAKVTVTRQLASEYSLSISAPDIANKLGRGKTFVSKFEVEREKAISAKDEMRVLFIGNVSFQDGKPVRLSVDVQPATFTNPVDKIIISTTLRTIFKEVWFYNAVTGEIYAKQKLN